ncbi:hypothetical protein [Leucobacter sp. OH1287]|uniref:hypothetical protein n=1 Tax=Leucobacter sp. OH1287 TaxID=2491049 RepID=UPI000F5E2898|nr:hypothetical protein [Leucobacter sp. OH1287]RRD61758.1 hypothetical protein EII30_00115 [Leucobacter sp. OH1287]
MRIGKYITNFGILSSLAGAIGVSKQTKNMPKDWRRYVVWGVWLAGVVLTIASVKLADEDKEFIAQKKEFDKKAKRTKKS